MCRALASGRMSPIASMGLRGMPTAVVSGHFPALASGGHPPHHPRSEVGQGSSGVAHVAGQPSVAGRMSWRQCPLLDVYSVLLHEVAKEDLREIDKLREPEVHKNRRRQKVRRRLEPYWVARKRLDVGALYVEGCELLETPAEVQAELLRHGQPVFTRRELHEEDMDYSEQFEVIDAGMPQWQWPAGAIAEHAPRMPRSAPGPDGLGSLTGSGTPHVSAFMADLTNLRCGLPWARSRRQSSPLPARSTSVKGNAKKTRTVWYARRQSCGHLSLCRRVLN